MQDPDSDSLPGTPRHINVLLRYLVEDDAAQLAAARALIQRCAREQLTLFVPVTVALELEWVLRAKFGYAKDDVMQVMSELLSAAKLSFESERALEVALHLYRGGAADFSDCLHVALASEAGHAPLWTFDKGASKLDNARLVPR